MNCQNPGSCRPCRRAGTYTGAGIGFLIFVFALAIGMIIGAVNYETIVPVLSAVIAFASAILAIIIALLIYWRISKHNSY